MKIFTREDIKQCDTKKAIQNKLKETLVIPDGVTEIGECFDIKCYRFESVTIPTSARKIGENAFSFFLSLVSVNIPDSVTEIGSYAFCACQSLVSLQIPDSVTYIGRGVVNQDWRLKTITLPKNLTEIGEYSFSNCGLKHIIIPNSVTKIGEGAFATTLHLKHVQLPKQLTEIGKYAFAESHIVSIAIPNAVTKIGENAFEDCKFLKHISIPAHLEDAYDWNELKQYVEIRDIASDAETDTWKDSLELKYKKLTKDNVFDRIEEFIGMEESSKPMLIWFENNLDIDDIRHALFEVSGCAHFQNHPLWGHKKVFIDGKQELIANHPELFHQTLFPPSYNEQQTRFFLYHRFERQLGDEFIAYAKEISIAAKKPLILLVNDYSRLEYPSFDTQDFDEYLYIDD